MTTNTTITPQAGQHFIASGTVQLINDADEVVCKMSGVNFYLTGVAGLRFRPTAGAEIEPE